MRYISQLIIISYKLLHIITLLSYIPIWYCYKCYVLNLLWIEFLLYWYGCRIGIDCEYTLKSFYKAKTFSKWAKYYMICILQPICMIWLFQNSCTLDFKTSITIITFILLDQGFLGFRLLYHKVVCNKNSNYNKH